MKSFLLRLFAGYTERFLALWAITLRSVKGSALTHAEMDANFTTLRDVASQTSGSISGLTSLSTAAMTSTGTASAVTPYNTLQALTAYLMPSMSDGWQGIYRFGFRWWSENQQWGGPFGFKNLVDGATGTAYSGEAATGHVDTDGNDVIAYAAANTWTGTGFKVAETQTVAAVWLKLYKVGNPTDNLQVYIFPDDGGGTKPTGSTPITNGTATAQSGKLVTSDTNGAWYRFVFATPPTLTGGTQYHIVAKSSGAVSTTNYWAWRQQSAKKYPFGNYSYADATPTWTAAATYSRAFLVELSATAQILQDSGTFDGKLQFGGSGASGTLSMSRGLCNSVPLHELIDVTDFTLYFVGTALTKDATILDIGYGEDHDRIVLRSNVTTGYGQVDVYESDTTKTTKTATAVDLSSGTHSVGIRVRAKNDGSDVITLFIDGTEYTSSTLTLGFDNLFGKLGTFWLGGGFALAPTWTGNAMTNTAQLPSHADNGSWTWTGTGTEANCMSMQGGKLFQNKNGYASTDTGNYVKNPSLPNAGYACAVKMAVLSGTNLINGKGSSLSYDDGTVRVLHYVQEYFVGAYAPFPQKDLKTVENVLSTKAKGSDFLLFANGKLSYDGSGAYTTAAVSANIIFGDSDAVAGENADAVYSYLKYYTTDWNPPQFTSGSIDEIAIWQGDQTALWALLYNSGTQVSVKQLLGVPRNYLDKSDKIPAIVQRGITANPTTTTTTFPPAIVANEMEAFAITGGEPVVSTWAGMNNSTASQGLYWGAAVDGVISQRESVAAQVSGNNISLELSVDIAGRVGYLGLHKVEGRWGVGANTGMLDNVRRQLRVEPKL